MQYWRYALHIFVEMCLCHFVGCMNCRALWGMCFAVYFGDALLDYDDLQQKLGW